MYAAPSNNRTGTNAEHTGHWVVVAAGGADKTGAVEYGDEVHIKVGAVLALHAPPCHAHAHAPTHRVMHMYPRIARLLLHLLGARLQVSMRHARALTHVLGRARACLSRVCTGARTHSCP